jgi:malate dehydrogenase
MSRDDLVAKNTEIVKSVSENVKKHCPDAIVIVVCNPLDAMVYAAWKVTDFPTNRIMGMAGALDTARFSCFVSRHLDVAIEDINTVLLGGHGDDMVPLPRFSSAAGIPLTELINSEKMDEIIKRTRKGGIEIVNLLGTSAYYAPAAGAVKMAEAIFKNAQKTISCCAYCKTEYDVGGAFVGVPAVLGANGIEKIVEIDLNLEEEQAFQTSVAHVKQLTDMVDKLL